MAVDLEIYLGVTHAFIQMGRVIAEAVRADAERAPRHAFATSMTSLKQQEIRGETL